MAIRLWPADYERKEHITREEKFLLRQADRNFNTGHFVIGMDPLGMSNADVHMGMYISPTEGLITFSVYPAMIDETKIQEYITYVKFAEKLIYERLLDSKLLIVRNDNFKVLKFPYKHMLLFPNQKPKKSSVPTTSLNSLLNYAAIDFFRPVTSDGNEKRISQLKIFDGIRSSYDSSFKELSVPECRAIFERLAPEYTVVMNELEHIRLEEKKTFICDENFQITGKETEFKTFFLDDYQVAQVNDMGKGHRVILANPGAGKSVLLLSKAFKYASLYKESKILLTCYNNNLADSYRFKRECAGIGNNNNLYIMTFHKLVKKIYEECLHSRCESNIASEEEIQRCIAEAKQGKIGLSFKAIFIDEVQIFDPLYLELCYHLLEKDDPNHVFLMAGDLNQSVKKLSRKGDAPWKNINGVTLDFTGRVRYIEKNYRNSREIAEYIFNMLTHINERLSMLGLINSMEYEYNSFKIGDKPTIALKVKTEIKRMDIKAEVSDAIKEITEKHCISYSDVAVIFPYKKHHQLKYNFLYWIQQALEEAGIPYSLITPSDNGRNERRRYSQTAGVILSTIDSSLGLDFKAVILAGLYPYNYVFGEHGTMKKITSWSEIQKMNDAEQSNVQNHMRAVYTACSRARDVLYILSDLDPDTPMEEILKK
jgi:hypothetical protein